jgi:hypothetical protein
LSHANTHRQSEKIKNEFWLDLLDYWLGLTKTPHRVVRGFLSAFVCVWSA